MFYSTVVNETAHLIAQWMSVGFAHGERLSRPIASSHRRHRRLLIPTVCFPPQACATQTTSACCPSPSTTARLASWSPMTPVCTMTLTGPPLQSPPDLLSVGRCQTEAVMLQISSPTRPTMRADTASALRPTSPCSTWRSS